MPGGNNPTPTPSHPRTLRVVEALSSNLLGRGLSVQGLVASNLNLKPGECLRVRGEVAPDAKR